MPLLSRVVSPLPGSPQKWPRKKCGLKHWHGTWLWTVYRTLGRGSPKDCCRADLSIIIPVACPNHFASGDVCTLLSILKSAPVAADLILVNQDLAGFFTSIDQDRFIGAWFMLLDFLRPHMDVSDNEAFSVYPGKTNNPGDIIKGRTFRRLNVTERSSSRMSRTCSGQH